MSDWQSIRGDAAKLHTDPRNVIFRPASVAAAYQLFRVGAVVNAVWGLVIILTVLISEERFGNHITGPFWVSSDAFWFFLGLLTILVGWWGWKTAPGVYTGEKAARYPSTTVATLNLLLGFFAFPWGLFQGVIGLLQLITVNSVGNEQWIQKDVTQHG
jgi:hypothetical protein